MSIDTILRHYEVVRRSEEYGYVVIRGNANSWVDSAVVLVEDECVRSIQFVIREAFVDEWNCRKRQILGRPVKVVRLIRKGEDDTYQVQYKLSSGEKLVQPAIMKLSNENDLLEVKFLLRASISDGSVDIDQGTTSPQDSVMVHNVLSELVRKYENGSEVNVKR